MLPPILQRARRLLLLLLLLLRLTSYILLRELELLLLLLIITITIIIILTIIPHKKGRLQLLRLHIPHITLNNKVILRLRMGSSIPVLRNEPIIAIITGITLTTSMRIRHTNSPGIIVVYLLELEIEVAYIHIVNFIHIFFYITLKP